jgi:hypothetical protein
MVKRGGCHRVAVAGIAVVDVSRDRIPLKKDC